MRVRRRFGGPLVEFAGPFARLLEGAGLQVLEVFGDAAGDVVGGGRGVADDDRLRAGRLDPLQRLFVALLQRVGVCLAAQFFAASARRRCRRCRRSSPRPCSCCRFRSASAPIRAIRRTASTRGRRPCCGSSLRPASIRPWSARPAASAFLRPALRAAGSTASRASRRRGSRCACRAGRRRGSGWSWCLRSRPGSRRRRRASGRRGRAAGSAARPRRSAAAAAVRAAPRRLSPRWPRRCGRSAGGWRRGCR